MTDTGATVTNKQILNQALRHVHYAQAYMQRFDANTSGDYYYYTDEILEDLHRVESHITKVRRINEQR